MGNFTFDIESIRVSQKFADTNMVAKEITTVPVRKPNKQEFVRTHSDPEYRVPVAVIERKDERECYVVLPQLIQALASEISYVSLIATMNRQGTLFLWPVKMPNDTDRKNSWQKSSMEAATLAQKSWIRMVANMSLGAYEIYRAQGEIADPEWPSLTFEQIIQIAFKDMVIESLDHPVVKELRGMM